MSPALPHHTSHTSPTSPTSRTPTQTPAVSLRQFSFSHLPLSPPFLLYICAVSPCSGAISTLSRLWSFFFSALITVNELVSLAIMSIASLRRIYRPLSFLPLLVFFFGSLDFFWMGSGEQGHSNRWWRRLVCTGASQLCTHTIHDAEDKTHEP